MSKYPFNQIRTGSQTAPAQGPAGGKSPDATGCAAQVRPDDANNPKTIALRGLARSLNVSMSQLMDGFATAVAHGVGTVDDRRMPATLAQALGLDPSTVQQAMTVMLSRPPFDRGADVASVAGAKK
jgi:hypothetical protein